MSELVLFSSDIANFFSALVVSLPLRFLRRLCVHSCGQAAFLLGAGAARRI